MTEEIKSTIASSIDENISYLKTLLLDNSDVVYREFIISGKRALLVYIDGMGDKILLDNFVIYPLLKKHIEVVNLKTLKDSLLNVSDLREEESFSKAINSMLSGDTIMIIDGEVKVFVIASRLWPARGVGEPLGESVLRGAREGFTETIRFNTALIRRRIRDTRLRIKPLTVGIRSKSDVIITYIDDIVDKNVLKDLEERISKIKIDAILDSGYIEQLIEDNKFSPFPQIQSTERPDVVAASLYEGRIAILVDNSPFALIVPTTLPTLFQSPDDYFQRWMYTATVRILRLVSIFLALILPALYIAVTSYNISVIPTKMAYSIAASREGVPFPAFLEVVIMEFTMALLMEAIIRLPKPIGSTIGIVGGLVVGQAAVSAGIISPILLIIVALTTITSFLTPNYEVAIALRLLRFFLIILSSLLGLYGILIGLIIILTHLIRLKSFGVPYLAPIANPNKNDLMDLFIRYPLHMLKKRPKFLNPMDKIRQK